ncbi:VCBS domain-containing protein [Halomonas denitrificans]|uniref:VCBS domain-containing protein n=1 Tax=Halomonas denitrificans TaxID=370769 RepID=UPI001CD203DC|nr:VCBS domain-containing protein [Halomonas denitrificans]MCA0973494.1 VCBS domain-containing protein [Halomonas denitrificans]
MKGSRTRRIALEPRLLFDGAMAASADHADSDQQQDTGDKDKVAVTPASQSDGEGARSTNARHLVVLDARLSDQQRQAIRNGLADDAEWIVVDSDENGVAAITSALAGMDQVQSIEIFSHGSDGQFQLGNTLISSQTLSDFNQQLGQWRDALSADADLLLYGCRVAASDHGVAFLENLSEATGMDVGASSDNTGSALEGGDWVLERQLGELDDDRGVAVAALASLDGLLADAQPVADLPASSAQVPLGETFEFSVNVSNASSAQEGYAPFVQLVVPATGKDGAGAAVDDGITITSASYLGGQLDLLSVTFDANGQAEHPLARGSDGQPLVINAADFGARAGDTLIVVALPFASLTAEQPDIEVTFTGRLSALADTAQTNGSPDLVIQALAGFELGNDAQSNPEQDPTLLGSAVAFTITPTVIAVEQTLNMSEGDTTTGENYPHSLVTTVRPAGAGITAQTLTDVVITQPIPTNVQVTAIDPGAGTLTSITLASGLTLVRPDLIQRAIDGDAFITSYTVTYDSLTEAQSSRVDFFVPEYDADGNAILDPANGNEETITFGAPSGAGVWLPLDSRDRDPNDPDGKVSFAGTGDEISFVAKSLTVEKSASVVVDTGSSGLTPGDTLEYQLEVALSDYFAFGKDTQLEGQFIVTDSLGDGQTLTGAPTLTLYSGTNATTIELDVTSTTNTDGTTTLVFDIAESIRKALGDQAWLAGDAAFDNVIDAGATRAVIGYRAVVDQAYVGVTDHPDINEGDSIGNSAQVNATLLYDANNLTGFSEADNSSTNLTVPVSDVDIAIEGGVTELAPGDEVTFTLSYDLITGDHEGFQLIAYLPLPLLDTGVVGTDWNGLNPPGSWSMHPDNTWTGSIASVESGPGNSIIFTFDDLSATQASTIAVSFTMTVGNQPFADGRSLDVLAESRQTTTIDKTELISQDVVKVQSVAEPVVSITHGVVSSTNGSVSGTSGSWNAPGTSGAPFTGSITDPAAVDGDVTDIDAGDTLRLATLLENTGGGGAFDVATSIELPADLAFVGGSLASANLILTLGDGTVLTEGTDYSVSGTTITLLDAGGQATLQAGRDGSASDAAGRNIIVITYDVIVASAVAASRTLGTTATLNYYASTNGGPDFTATDLSDDATQQVAAPTITTTFADGGSATADDSSESHTGGANLVVGESMLYDIVVTLPEGGTQNLRISDLIPPGMALDTTFNGDAGYLLITDAAGSGNLSADFAGSLTISGFTGDGGTLGGEGIDGLFTFTAASASADNDAGNNTFVLRVRLIATNTLNNQDNSENSNPNFTHEHKASLSYQDADGDEVNGSTAVERDVSQSGAGPITTLVEPAVTVEQTLTIPADPGLGIDAGDAIEYTVVLTNVSIFGAFDLDLSVALPTELDSPSLASVSFSDATGPSLADFEIIGTSLRLKAGSDVDLRSSQTITLVIQGTASATAVNLANLTSVARVDWTSLNDETTTSAGEERDGSDGAIFTGVINDYRNVDTLEIPIAQTLLVSRVGGMQGTDAADPTNAEFEDVAVGEIIRYRVVALLPEGSITNYQLVIEVDEGLTILPETANNILMAVLSNNGSITSTDPTTGDPIDLSPYAISGNGQSPEAGLINPDLSNGLNTELASGLYAITNGGRTLTISLGNLLINDGNDSDREGISLEFNVRVDNASANQTGTELGLTVTENRDDAAFGSQTLTQVIAEPSFTDMTKTVEAFNPSIGGGDGSATVQVSFEQDGGMPAYDVVLTDAFPWGSNYVIDRIVIDGQTYSLSDLPDGVTATASGSGISVTFAQLDPGTEVSIVYRVEVPNNTQVVDAQAQLIWSSLPDAAEADGGAFTDFGGSSVGTDSEADGERTGDDGSGGLNDYVLTASASLGVISGTLWDDTLSADTSTTPDGTGLAGVTVTLTWDGNNDGDFDDVDDLTFTTLTDANGNYSFGVLPSGNYRISASERLTDDDLGELRARIDSDDGSFGDGTLSRVDVSISAGGSNNRAADIGYVSLNDGPVHTLPASPVSGNEDTEFAIPGISVSDPDALAASVLTTTLSVPAGTLTLNQGGGNATISTNISGSGSTTITIEGTLADINAALATLSYQGATDANGDVTLTITTDDNANTGDSPDSPNGTPGEDPEDALTTTDRLTLRVLAVNDDPTAKDDAAIAIEAGGRFNTNGVNPNGFVVANDTDVDLNDADPDVLTVVQAGVSGGALQAVSDDPTQPTRIQGRYGTLVIGADGSAEYLLDNDNPTVEALRQSGDPLPDPEIFVYKISDRAGVSSQATITITIEGANDAPVGVDDNAVAIEKGGVANATGGQDGKGNVLDNDTDVDAFGETKVVTGIRNGDTILGSFVDVGGATDIEGEYGILTINPDGSYTYVIDDTVPAVEALASGDTLSETFTYRVTDALGLDGAAVLTITIRGAQDAPIATDNSTSAQAPSTDGSTAAVDGRGNLITDNDGDEVDSDVDTVDQGALRVAGIRAGSESAGGSLSVVGSAGASVNGMYGRLIVTADGGYRYVVDGANTAVQALAVGDTLNETFTYQVRDSAGNTDLAELVVTVVGANDPPTLVADKAVAVEAGGTANGTLGTDPSGNVLTNDSDVDGQAITVDQVRFATTTVSAGQALAGRFGTLTLNSDGSYSYVVDNSNPQVEALRTANDTLTDVFIYRAVDPLGATTSARLTITIEGRDDAPVASNNIALAVARNEDGSARNPSGNVLTNDSDIDAGDRLAVSGGRPGSEASGGSLAALSGGSVVLVGQYGTLTLNRDGSYLYEVDQNNAEILGLGPLEFRRDIFTYQARDLAGLTDLAELTVFVRGQNQAPDPVNDSGLAVEAGGRDNATTGQDAVGNVLTNDIDVDGDINLGIDLLGPNLSVTGVATGDGTEGSLGNALKGRYGSLIMNADGSYRYAVDDDDPRVQALRVSGQSLSESFTYALTDRWGGASSATLTITIDGRNDDPTARDDAGQAIDTGGGAGRPDAVGNVLPNDSDPDATANGETQRVASVSQQGVSAQAGEPLQGRYGTLIIEADGSYRYFIDRTNPDVLRASGLGPVLEEAFVYTLVDRAGATDTATLTLILDIAAPYIPIKSGDIGPHFQHREGLTPSTQGLGDLDPVVFVTPEVERNNREVTDYLRLSHGGQPLLVRPFETRIASLAEGLGQVQGQYVSYGVALSRAFAELDQIKLLGRHGRTDLTADGLLADPSLYAPTREQLLGNADASSATAAPSTTATASATGEAQQAPTPEQQRFDGRPPLPEGAQWLADTPLDSDATDKRQEAAPATASGFRQQLLAMADTTAPLRGDP